MNLHNYNRIAIIGNCGSGKSTLARQIAEQTGHPLIHLDYEHWSPGWVAMLQEAFIAKQQEWTAGERWIIEGNYNATLALRYSAADLVVLLDLSRWLCVWRVIKRHGKERPDMRQDVIEESMFSINYLKFLRFILGYKKKCLLEVLALHEEYQHVKLLRLRSRREVREILL